MAEVKDLENVEQEATAPAMEETAADSAAPAETRVNLKARWQAIPRKKRRRIIRLCILALLLVIAAVGSAMGSDDNGTDAPQQIQQETTGTPESGAGQAEEPAVTYTAYSVGQLMDDLDSNALKAESTYQDQYVELTGRLNVIDSDGDYISIVPQDDQFAILGVQCYLQTEEQRQQVLDMQIDQVITGRGQITSVGEVMGYSLDVDDFGA